MAVSRAAALQIDRIRFNEHERVGAEMTEKIMARLKYSNEEIERVCSLVKQHMVFKDTNKMRPSTLKKFLRQPHFDEHLALHKLDCMASHRDLSALNFCTEELARQPPEKLRPAPLITGADLIELNTNEDLLPVLTHFLGGRRLQRGARSK